ncbi:hypothetical protein C8A05DRAFT_20193 [Staphylotrichum tortipilum]|uniref:Uncharacterized protein n=1 Tax=Staphylotrichum tortipilum TaxID=2831512 RepID=A0AAN6M9C2_9PEZI|nr:hypothetical protein C8A05DRAFT_20193 [Staphylotrichum longicolle]
MKSPFSTTLLTFLALTPQASAQSPHFLSQGAGATINPDGSLTATWKEVGLGNNQLITYMVTAGATAQYACINGGGQHPKALNKETVQGPLSTTVELKATKNGAVDGSVPLGPLGPGNFNCPSGQMRVLTKVCYSNVMVKDTTNGIVLPLPLGQPCMTFVDIS